MKGRFRKVLERLTDLTNPIKVKTIPVGMTASSSRKLDWFGARNAVYTCVKIAADRPTIPFIAPTTVPRERGKLRTPVMSVTVW